MRWIQIGDRAHAVTRKNKGLTLCGLEVVRAKSILVSPPFEDRCGNCDKEWRKLGRATKAKKKPTPVAPRTTYKPRHSFNDWCAFDDIDLMFDGDDSSSVFE